MNDEKQMVKLAGNNIGAKLKNAWFYVPLILQVLISAIAGTGTKVETLQTWPAVGRMILDYISNPFLLSLLLIQIYGQLKSFDNKGAWRDDTITNRKPKPTDPDIEIVVDGPPVVTDDTVVILDNKEVENEEKFDPALSGPEVYSNGKNSQNEV